ncbi:MAG: MFS transporter [Hyphomicrobiaceae bacterium]|nr:MFS transporter [Hyphomicrobiaceae bacterium]
MSEPKPELAERIQRRNITVLALSQALFMSVQSAGISVTPLVGHGLLDAEHKWMATMPVFLVHFGVMLSTIPASYLMAAIGRRAGFTLGAVAGLGFGLLGCTAVLLGSFPLLCVASLLQGVQAACFWYFRLAAADSAPPSGRARAISLVMAGGVLAGFIGPQTAKWTVDALSVAFAGVYLATAVFSFLVIILVQFVSIPRLTAEQRAEPGRPMREIARAPAYRVALASSVLGYAVMTLTMSATPLAMLACGFGFPDSATVIQAHVVAMFLPSFFTGSLIARYGVLPVIAAGGAILLGCALVNLAGVAFANFLIANILVGIGWNFTYVGGSTLLTSTYSASERAKVQGSHDFAVYAATATAAGLSGLLAEKAGWIAINLAAVPLMALIMASAFWLMRRQDRGLAHPAE